MSTLCFQDREIRQRRRDKPPKCSLIPECGCWDAGEYPADCHIMWSAIILGVFSVLLFIRECWSFSRIHGFFVERKLKGRKQYD